ncbi:hypothetical protein P152DRAFT_256249 [Eremomyces bilateralis CBS 781.70]|uniref:DUF7707 domain-containing protein n=1 Tax=Eremomyces bilateralis CBS 781.70 TaxID=1392243 RepID=A0A6G1FR25_9PEZI|nr:uncharacterized protein P152DRAFT_256249 [Eremomyces bilateralis CBS 781.70]KAF1808131.1 hypothetical protein P152DRAFT_256249 [Eremomyces bilateralis CBS 781.70]
MKSFATLALYVLAVGLTDALDLSIVPTATKDAWCVSQKAQCPLLCLQYPGDNGDTITNTCDSKSLAWSCVCSVNGLTPNMTQYHLTIPYYICTETNNQCKNLCAIGDGACATNCEVNNLCGAQSPTRINSSTISTTMSSTAGPTATDADGNIIYSGFGGDAAATGSSGGDNGGGVSGTGAASGLYVEGPVVGMAALVAAVGLGFGILA